jgi:ABC-2 type transport system permease protein
MPVLKNIPLREVKVMRRYFHLYRSFFRFSLVSALAYPVDFIAWTIIDLFWAVINTLFYKVLLLNMTGIAGWNFHQLSIPLGLYFLLNTFIWGFFYGNMRNLVFGINKGDLDLVLTKPVSSQFMVSVKSIGLNMFPSLLVGIFLTVYGFQANHLSLIKLLFVPFILLISIIIFYSLYFISCTFSLWANRLANIPELMPNFADVAKMPTSIFPPVLRFLFTFILPLAMLAIFPAKVLLGWLQPLYLAIPLTISAILLYLSHLFWHFSLRHYSGASS